MEVVFVITVAVETAFALLDCALVIQAGEEVIAQLASS